MDRSSWGVAGCLNRPQRSSTHLAYVGHGDATVLVARPMSFAMSAGRAHRVVHSSRPGREALSSMSWISILLLGLAMSTDAFAAALGKGAGLSKPRLVDALRIGIIFGVVEAITPVVGWLIGTAAARRVEAWDHWIAFTLLTALGLHMMWKAWKSNEEEQEPASGGGIFSLALTGLATSIDAMAVGVGLAFVDTPIWIVAVAIGLCTFAMVTLGIMLGHVIGRLVGRWAEAAGGVILIAVGTAVLVEHLSSA